MTNEERRAWLDGLSAGSQVAEMAYHYKPMISEVAKKTKTQTKESG